MPEQQLIATPYLPSYTFQNRHCRMINAFTKEPLMNEWKHSVQEVILRGEVGVRQPRKACLVSLSFRRKCRLQQHIVLW
jgi:hypothetical protein